MCTAEGVWICSCLLSELCEWLCSQQSSSINTEERICKALLFHPSCFLPPIPCALISSTENLLSNTAWSQFHPNLDVLCHAGLWGCWFLSRSLYLVLRLPREVVAGAFCMPLRWESCPGDPQHFRLSPCFQRWCCRSACLCLETDGMSAGQFLARHMWVSK